MFLRSCALALAVMLAGSPVAAQAAPAFQAAFLFGDPNLDEAEKELEAGQAQDAADTLLAVHEHWQGKGGMAPDMKAKMLKLRTDIARAGGVLGTYKQWNYDGANLGSAVKYVDFIEDKMSRFEGVFKLSQDQAAEELVLEIRKVFARPEFTSNPALVQYRDTFAEPGLARWMRELGKYWARDFGNFYRFAAGNIAEGDYEGTKSDVESARRLYAKLKSSGFDTAGFKFAPDAKDKLADEISIEDGIKRLDEMMAKSGKLAAKAKAARQARAAAWKAALKADKLKLYAQLGEPHNWPGGWGQEDAWKAAYWSYYERASENYRWMNTYYFDEAGKKVREDRRLIWSP